MPCCTPMHLSTHQQALVEQGEPSTSRKQKHSGQQDTLIPVPLLPPSVTEMPAGECGRRAGSSRAYFDTELQLLCCDRETTSKVKGAETLPTQGMCNHPRCHPSHGAKAPKPFAWLPQAAWLRSDWCWLY